MLVCAIAGGILGLPIALLMFKIRNKKAKDIPIKLIQEVKNETTRKESERTEWGEYYSRSNKQHPNGVGEGESRERNDTSPVESDGDQEHTDGEGGIPIPVYKRPDKPRKKFKLHRSTIA